MDIHPADEMPSVLATFRTLVDGRQRIGQDVPMLRKDGGVFHADVTHHEIAINGRRCTVGFFRDITERKQTAEALRQSHDELQAIYAGMVDGLHILNLETMKPVRTNPALCRMMGYSEEELLLLSAVDVHPPEELPRVLRGFQAYLDGQNSGDSDVPLIRKDGKVIYADIAGSRIVYRGIPSVVCFFHDTTERRKTQEALARQHRTLKHLLQSSDHERQLISYEIHDGLAQQLAGAMMQFQTFGVLKDKNPKDAAKAFDAGLTMLRQGHIETRRLIAGVRPPILDESGVSEAVAHLIHEHSREKEPKIEYVSMVDFNRLVPTLENAIYRICQEALTNACQHSQSEKVRVSLLQVEDRVRIEIRDWGIGFNPRTVRENRYGLEGIRHRARLLGGKCSIQSKSGRGTRVVVELPVVEREEDE
jgi:PAS domain S-box-containing protein